MKYVTIDIEEILRLHYDYIAFGVPFSSYEPAV